MTNPLSRCSKSGVDCEEEDDQLRGVGWLRDRRVSILYDTGSDGCFVSPELVREYNMKSIRDDKVDVTAVGLIYQQRMRFTRYRAVSLDLDFLQLNVSACRLEEVLT